MVRNCDNGRTLMKIVKIIFYAVILIFAVIGMLFTSVFVAMQFGWLNVKGSIDARNESMLQNNSLINLALNNRDHIPATAANTPDAAISADYSCLNEQSTCLWSDTREWSVVAGGLTKDLAIIERVSSETGVPSRLIAAVIIPEQIRFFTANREVFKRYFEPLKILGSLSKFSLGVSGIKQNTAKAIELNAQNPNSEFYPGDSYATLLAYNNEPDLDKELYNRLTNEKDHYYSYLYTAIFIKEILAQWEKAGFDISNQPEIVATIFNLGFTNSKPKPDPQVGGATIEVGGADYSFGKLAGLFYYSDELQVIK